MDVNKQVNRPALQRLIHHHLHGVDLRRQVCIRSGPLSIEVKTRETGSVVAYNNAIRVKHRHQFKNKGFSKARGLTIIAHKKFKKPFHDQTCIGFAWMDSARYNHAFALRNLVLARLEVSDH